MEFTLEPRKVRNFLAGIILLLTIAHVLRTLALWRFHQDFPLFNMDEETNIPTFYSAVQLLICSGLQIMIAVQHRRAKKPFWIQWAFLGVLFFYLSCDEAAKIHERIEYVAQHSWNPSLVFSLLWRSLAVISLLLLPFYVRFWLSLSSRFRFLFLISAIIFIGGAVGMDYVTDHLTSALGLAIFLPVEEVMEMVGILTFLYSLLLYMQGETDEVRIRLRSK